ncbi:unnamed protein product [Calypogeia fissa]
MHVWHMDSYDKLAQWGFKIHGAIDGATHYVVYMDVTLNKKAMTIYLAYIRAVQRFRHPLMIHSDYATEHTFVRQDLEMARPNSRCFRMAASVHNQRIEAFWLHLRNKATQYFKEALKKLTFREGVLEIEYPLHRYCMVTVFLPLLREAVNDAVSTWNAHRVRAVRRTDGVRRPSHIPQIAFQAAERESRIVAPPEYVEGAVVNHVVDATGHVDDPRTDYWNHNDDRGNFEEGIHDLYDEGLRFVRDTAFELNQHSVNLPEEKLRMHLLLSLECQYSADLGLGLGDYVQNQLRLGNLSDHKLWALNTLQLTLQYIAQTQNM